MPFWVGWSGLAWLGLVKGESVRGHVRCWPVLFFFVHRGGVYFRFSLVWVAVCVLLCEFTKAEGYLVYSAMKVCVQ